MGSIRLDGLHHDEGVQEVAGDHVRREGGVGLLENDGHDVVANVPLPLQLLRIALGVGQQGGHMEHDLPLLEHLVHGRVASVSVLDVQPSAVALVILEPDPLAQHVQELVEGRRGHLVAEQLLLGGLSISLVEHSELEVRDEDMLVVDADQLRGLGAQHRNEVVHLDLVVQQPHHLQRTGLGSQTRDWDQLVHRPGPQP